MIYPRNSIEVELIIGPSQGVGCYALSLRRVGRAIKVLDAAPPDLLHVNRVGPTFLKGVRNIQSMAR